MKYDFNDLRIGEAIHPETKQLAAAIYVRKTDDLNWHPYYIAEDNEKSSWDEVIELAKVWFPSARIQIGGYYHMVAEVKSITHHLA